MKLTHYLFADYIKLEQKVSYLRGLLCNFPPLLCEALWESIRGPAQLDHARRAVADALASVIEAAVACSETPPWFRLLNFAQHVLSIQDETDKSRRNLTSAIKNAATAHLEDRELGSSKPPVRKPNNSARPPSKTKLHADPFLRARVVLGEYAPSLMILTLELLSGLCARPPGAS
ncbi:hypothetical protein Ciccas_011408 [Cichlidogyrus casuarinus]|uniref:Uncharacterized protein n=1 Tax=Cichlidogyrus casuarinus TaxID=1844966 RepID=A0ABD2PSI2_9PLAT